MGKSAAKKKLRATRKSVPAFAQRALTDFREELFKAQSETKFIVFLCGPSLSKRKDSGSRLRRQLLQRLKKEGIEVVLGEDDGLEELRQDFGLNAQDNELEFIKRYCDAIVIIAGSVGSFCELGLFSWHYSHKNGSIKESGDKDFIVLIAKKHKKSKSYLNEGPGRAIQGFGLVDYINFENFEIEGVIHRLLERRATYVLDRRGRPPKAR